MKTENELQQIIQQLNIPPEQASSMIDDIQAADQAWNDVAEPRIPAGLFRRVDKEMTRALARRRIERVRFWRTIAAAACLVLVLGGVLYHLNLAGRNQQQASQVVPLAEQPVEQSEVVVDDDANLHYELKYWQESRQNIYNIPIDEDESTETPATQQEPPKDESAGLVLGSPVV